MNHQFWMIVFWKFWEKKFRERKKNDEKRFTVSFIKVHGAPKYDFCCFRYLLIKLLFLTFHVKILWGSTVPYAISFSLYLAITTGFFVVLSIYLMRYSKFCNVMPTTVVMWNYNWRWRNDRCNMLGSLYKRFKRCAIISIYS